MATLSGTLTLLVATEVMLLGAATSGGCVAAPSWTVVPVAADPDDRVGFLLVPDDSRFSGSYRCGGTECGGIHVGCVLRAFPRKPEQWKDNDLGPLLPFMSEAGLRFLQIEAGVRRAYGAIGDATIRASSIVFTTAAKPSKARLGQVAAVGLSGDAAVRDQSLPVHVLQWIEDHAPQQAVCVGDNGVAPSTLESLTLSFATRMSGTPSR